jgi:hypothetical protein
VWLEVTIEGQGCGSVGTVLVWHETDPEFHPQHHINQVVCVCVGGGVTPVIPACGRWSQEDQRFQITTDQF